MAVVKILVVQIQLDTKKFGIKEYSPFSPFSGTHFIFVLQTFGYLSNSFYL